MIRVSVPLVAVALAATLGCGKANPTAPQIVTITTPQGQDDPVRLSGRVYESSESSEVPLARADVVVTTADGSITTLTGPRGFYAVTIPTGTATITVSKGGYASKTWVLDVSENVVLNFSLKSRLSTDRQSDDED